MNIAFEISPLITASGTFGDKSGVHRYMFGLLTSLVELAKKGKLKIVLFTFNNSFLNIPVTPEIYEMVDNKHVFFIDKVVRFDQVTNIATYLNRVLNIKPNQFFRLLNKIFFVTYLLENLSKKLKFKEYLRILDKLFIKHKIDIILHSETGFFPVGDYKNVIIMYDLTPIMMPELHRRAVSDMQKRKLRFVKDFVQGVICISRSTKKDVLDYDRNFKNKKILIAYPGIDKNFTPEFQSKNGISLKDLNLVLKEYKNSIKKKRYIFYYGTLEPRKNIAYLVRIFDDLQKNKEIPGDFKLVLSGGEGWGKVKKVIENYIAENYPISGKTNIILMNFLNDEYVIEFIKNAYAVVYPSLYEGFGLPVLESMAIGTPVITSNSSSLPEVGGDAVLYINPLNYFDIYHKIQYLINNPKILKGLSRRGIIQSQKFQWDKTSKKVLNFLKEL